jgi:hypothetical protein
MSTETVLLRTSLYATDSGQCHHFYPGVNLITAKGVGPGVVAIRPDCLIACLLHLFHYKDVL